ncbi:hypothetical protein OHC33_010814 [Knufia fluminis]|uniref:Velvet domain-containing protein n=2 Tax=Knufia TaxID=430999 RepID=A0AAN8EY45_9EURO|nr:hypothetical protein OHC33_010814 [Knufia fluminis]
MYQAAPTHQSTVTYGQVAPQSPHPSLVSDENTPAKVEDEEAFRIENPPPPPELHRYNGNIWKLRVVQEPKRARMCGYGDKDRRPISHPPIVQLTITDAETGEEIDYNNGSLTINHFTCLAHLCGIKGYDDKSVLRGHPSQQIISACNTGGYPTATIPESPDRVAPRIQPQQYSGSMYAQNGYPNNTANQSLFPAMDRPPTWRGQYPNMMGPAPTPYGPAPPRPGMQLPPMHSYEMRPQQPPTPPAESPTNVNAGHTFARNLIGATSSSAHLLQDENFKWGIYFLFADLSVRTEDWFRLKFQVFNVAECLDGLTKEEIEQKAASNNAAPSTNSDGKRGSKNLEGIRNSLVGQSAPCLATCWSHCFRVYSAKKFPGVAEGTELMRHFNRQGVKISIRKEKDDTEKGEKGAKQGKKRKAQDEGDAEEGSDFDDLGDD